MATNNANDFNNPLAIAQGGTAATSMATTDGVAYYTGSAVAVTNAGTSGQVLTSNGTGMAPTWQTAGSSGGAPSGQGWDLIQSQSFSGGTLNFTGVTNAYNTYVVVYSAGIASAMNVRYSIDGGSTYVATGYRSSASLVDMTIAFGSQPAPATDSLEAVFNAPIGGSAAAYGSLVYLFNVTNGQNCTLLGFGANDRKFNMCYASFGNASAINALQFLGSGIGFAGPGTISLYGVNE